MVTSSTQRLITVALPAAVLVALAAAVALTSVAAAKPQTAKQRVANVSNGVASAYPTGRFVLTPLQPGALKRDSGTQSVVESQRDVMREGQRILIVSGVATNKGKRGSFVERYRIEWVDAGNGYHVGTGTWKIVRGTGQYAGITGRGRGGHVWLDRGTRPWHSREEGFLSVR